MGTAPVFTVEPHRCAGILVVTIRVKTATRHDNRDSIIEDGGRDGVMSAAIDRLPRRLESNQQRSYRRHPGGHPLLRILPRQQLLLKEAAPGAERSNASYKKQLFNDCVTMIEQLFLETYPVTPTVTQLLTSLTAESRNARRIDIESAGHAIYTCVFPK